MTRWLALAISAMMITPCIASDELKTKLLELKALCDDGLLTSSVCEQRQMELLRQYQDQDAPAASAPAATKATTATAASVSTTAAKTPAATVGVPTAVISAKASEGCADISGNWKLVENGATECFDKTGEQSDEDFFQKLDIQVAQQGCAFSVLNGQQVLATGTLAPEGEVVWYDQRRDAYQGDYLSLDAELAGAFQGDKLRVSGDGQALVKMMFKDQPCPYNTRITLSR